jgi:hypothetical protein
MIFRGQLARRRGAAMRAGWNDAAWANRVVEAGPPWLRGTSRGTQVDWSSASSSSVHPRAASWARRRRSCRQAEPATCMGILSWIVRGLVAGWLAGRLMRGGHEAGIMLPCPS